MSCKKQAEYPLSPKRDWAAYGSSFRQYFYVVPWIVYWKWIVLPIRFFICTALCRRNMPLRRRMGRAANRRDLSSLFDNRNHRNELFWRCTTISELMINEKIRDREVRLIGVNGEQLGIMSSREAQKLAEEAELDLVKIAPTAKPPVCKIIDYGKYRYELARKEKEAKKKQKVVEVKEIRMSPNIESNDLNTKMNAAKKFLEKGNKVKVTLRFRGREMAHMQSRKHILDDFAESLADVAVIEKAAKVEGRNISMVLTEKK